MNQQPYPGNVLIIERESACRVQWRDALASLGPSVQCVESLKAAQDFVAKTPDWMDYLIINPGVMDGNGSGQFVKRILGAKHPPVLAVMLHQLEDVSLLEMAYSGAQLVPKPQGPSGMRMIFRLLQRLRHTQDGIIAFARRYNLSRHETEVLEAQFNGVSDKTIAQNLNSTEHAINQTIRRIHKKLGASSFREIVSQWIHHIAGENSSADDEAPSSANP